MSSAISCLLWSSVYKCQKVEFTSRVRTEGRMFVMYCMQILQSPHHHSHKTDPPIPVVSDTSVSQYSSGFSSGDDDSPESCHR